MPGSRDVRRGPARPIRSALPAREGAEELLVLAVHVAEVVGIRQRRLLLPDEWPLPRPPPGAAHEERQVGALLVERRGRVVERFALGRGCAVFVRSAAALPARSVCAATSFNDPREPASFLASRVPSTDRTSPQPVSRPKGLHRRLPEQAVLLRPGCSMTTQQLTGRNSRHRSSADQYTA